MIRRIAALLAAAAAVALGAHYGTPSAGGDVMLAQTAPEKSKVLVQDNFFEPRSTQIREDGRVTWSWRGMNRHNIAFTKVPEGASRKGARTRTDGRWKRTFHKPGVYRYVCRLFAGMRGTVTVRRAQPPQ